MVSFIDWIYWLQSWGVADVLIPFFLIFSIVFAVLSKSHVLGKPKEANKFNFIIALSMSFAVVIPHVLWGTPDPTYPYLITGVVDLVKVINNSLAEVAIVIVAMIMIMLMLGVFGKRWSPKGSGGGLFVLLALGIVTYIFGTNAGWFNSGRFPFWLSFLIDPQTQMLLITILVFGIIIWLITKDDDDPKKENKGLKALGDLLNLDDANND